MREAWRYLRKRDYAHAIFRLNQTWVLEPENGDVYHGFALVSLQRDKNKKAAERFFRIAISKPEVSQDAFIGYGKFLWSEGRLDEGLEHFYKTLDRWPRVNNARAGIALIYYRKKEFVKACQWARSAREFHDDLQPGLLDDACGRS